MVLFLGIGEFEVDIHLHADVHATLGPCTENGLHR